MIKQSSCGWKDVNAELPKPLKKFVGIFISEDDGSYTTRICSIESGILQIKDSLDYQYHLAYWFYTPNVRGL